MHPDIQDYHSRQTATDKAICQLLYETICHNLPEAEHKVWHAHPVWFLDGNPIVGYSKLKDCIRLLFWSGPSFDEPDLKIEGKFKAAEKRFTNVERVDVENLKRWLEKAKNIQWDYKNLIKRKGLLERLK